MKLTIIALVLASFQLSAQSAQPNQKKLKLVVGIVVDQMRQEYLYRYSNKFGKGGFKRLMDEGFMLKNAHYNYARTVTGAGHASIYTGTTPSIHGIISNEWYDKTLKKEVNCVSDPDRQTVGADQPRTSASPWRMLTTTITDELEISSQNRSKVIGVSFKDRGAILPAGHNPDGAYWYDGRSGKFITSTYYMQQLPEWLNKFNSRNLADKYLSQEWKTLLPIEQYTESGPDDSPYEIKFTGKDKPVFPYNLKDLRKQNGEFDLLSSTPFADDYLVELAKAAIDGEKLGADEWTDFLSVSFSAPDIIGHSMGPNAIEVEDVYLRLDRNIEDLLRTLDEKFGRDNYVVFLSSDHGVAEVVQSLKDNKVPSGYFNSGKLKTDLNEYLQRYFPGKNVVEVIDGDQIFFDHGVFQQDPRSSGVEMIVASELVANFLQAQEGVYASYTESILRQSAFNEEGIKGMVVRGYHPKRSGDIIFIYEPGWYSGTRVQGTTHGSPHTYDTHIPMIFFGGGISSGSSSAYHAITDIAPTLSILLGIKFPNGCTGKPITEILDRK
jgi:predicted AlkP superfamily pyrophosphatase or phosphodiesterase